MTHFKYQRGFTLVELIMVIVLMGVIGGMVAVFMKSPIDAYFDSARRAALTDTADTVVRRMARDIQRALPNSINTSGDNLCVEFIPTKTGARYRADDTTEGLSFTSAKDENFNMLGSNTTFAANSIPTDQRIASGDVIVVYNLGITGSDAYARDNTASVNGTPTIAVAGPAEETAISITSDQPATSPTFPLASGSNRFQVVPANEKVVAYVCSGASLYRVASTVLAHICPATGSATVSSTDPKVATNVDCSGTGTSSWFRYSGSDLMRNALVSMKLTITDSAESITLQHEVHVSNTP